MPAYDLLDDPVDDWNDEVEVLQDLNVEDDIAELYLSAEEVWPLGVTIRDIFCQIHDEREPGFESEGYGDFEDLEG